MKLKDDDVLQVGDVCHWASGKKETVEFSYLVGKRIDYVLGALKNVNKITRKTPRVSRKEYKRRVETAIQLIELQPTTMKRITNGQEWTPMTFKESSKSCEVKNEQQTR